MCLWRLVALQLSKILTLANKAIQMMDWLSILVLVLATLSSFWKAAKLHVRFRCLLRLQAPTLIVSRSSLSSAPQIRQLTQWITWVSEEVLTTQLKTLLLLLQTLHTTSSTKLWKSVALEQSRLRLRYNTRAQVRTRCPWTLVILKLSKTLTLASLAIQMMDWLSIQVLILMTSSFSWKAAKLHVQLLCLLDLQPLTLTVFRSSLSSALRSRHLTQWIIWARKEDFMNLLNTLFLLPQTLHTTSSTRPKVVVALG